MDDKSLMEYTGRSIAVLANGFLKQLPNRLHASLDMTPFLKSLSWQPNPNAEDRVTVGPWELGPSQDTYAERAKQMEEWRTTETLHSNFFSEIVAPSQSAGIDIDSIEDAGNDTVAPIDVNDLLLRGA